MKKDRYKSLVVLLLSFLLLWFILKDNFTSSMKLLSQANLLYILLAILIYFIYFVIEADILNIIINKYSKKYNYKKTLKLSIMTKFFNGITPFSLGGQTLQIIELKKDKINVSKSTLIIVENFIIFQITIVILGLFSFPFIYRFNVPSLLFNATIIGFIVNVLLLLFTIFISVRIEIAKKIGLVIINFFNKIHKFKSKSIINRKWNKVCYDYAKGFKTLLDDKKKFIKCITLDVICMLIYFLIPIFIFKALNISFNLNILTILLIGIYIYLVGSYIPIPGGSVGIEYAFVNYFSLLILSKFLYPAVILWRFISYYLPMII